MRTRPPLPSARSRDPRQARTRARLRRCRSRRTHLRPPRRHPGFAARPPAASRCSRSAARPVRNARLFPITTAAAIAIAGRLHRRHAMDHGPGSGSSAIDARTPPTAGSRRTPAALARPARRFAGDCRNSSNCAVQAAQLEACARRPASSVPSSVDKLVPVEMRPRRPRGHHGGSSGFLLQQLLQVRQRVEGWLSPRRPSSRDLGDLVVRQIVIHARIIVARCFSATAQSRRERWPPVPAAAPRDPAILPGHPRARAGREARSSPASRTRD